MSHDSDPSTPMLSPAVKSGIAGGLLVGLTTAVIAFAFIGPLREYGFDFVDTLFVALIGGMFGVVAGAVAGASETGEHAPTPTRARVVKAKPAKAFGAAGDEHDRPPKMGSMTPIHRGA